MKFHRIRICRYQTVTDEHLRRKAMALKEKGLLESYSVDRHHLTQVRVSPTSPMKQIRTMEDLLRLYDDAPTQYTQASKILMPPNPFFPPTTSAAIPPAAADAEPTPPNDADPVLPMDEPPADPDISIA